MDHLHHQVRDGSPAHVIDHVFVGSKADAKDLEQLKTLHITHILNVTPTKKIDPVAGVPNFFEKEKLFEYRRCPLYDNKAEDVTGALDGCVAFIEQAKFYGRVLVHCNKGVSRSVSMVIAYLIKVHAMSYEDALRLVQANRPIAQPNPSFQRQLIAYANRMGRLRKRKEVEDSKGTSSSSSTVGPQLKATTASIGPQLPPHLIKRGIDDEESVQENQDKTEDALPSEQHPSVVIGPSLPQKKRKLNDDAENEEKKEIGPMIGPARPPPSSC